VVEVMNVTFTSAATLCSDLAEEDEEPAWHEEKLGGQYFLNPEHLERMQSLDLFPDQWRTLVLHPRIGACVTTTTHHPPRRCVLARTLNHAQSHALNDEAPYWYSRVCRPRAVHPSPPLRSLPPPTAPARAPYLRSRVSTQAPGWSNVAVHIKTWCRTLGGLGAQGSNHRPLAWLLLTSANLSRGALGGAEGPQAPGCRTRNFEMVRACEWVGGGKGLGTSGGRLGDCLAGGLGSPVCLRCIWGP
jgi:hypothetical protein